MKIKKEILLFLLVQPLLISNPYPLVAQGLEEVIKKYTDSIWGDTELVLEQVYATLSVSPINGGYWDF